MTPSRVVPYRMPDAAPVPEGGTTWKIDPHRSALLVQHMQKYVLRKLRGTAPVGELLANIGRLTQSARACGVPVVYVARPQGPRAGDVDRPGFAPLVAAPPEPSADARAFAEVLQPQPGDTVLTAKRYNAFAGTRLRSRLTELGRDQLVVVGAAAGTDVLLTAADAWMQDLQPVVVADALADRTAADHAMAVDWLAATCAMVTVTASVVDAFRGRSAATAAV